MSPLTLPLRLPLLPLHGLVRLAELIRDQAEQELHDPAAVRGELERLEAAVAAGEISPEEAAAAEAEAASRLVETASPAAVNDAGG